MVIVIVPFTRKLLRSSDVKRPETDIQAEDGRNLPEGFKPNGFGIHIFLYKGAYTYIQIFPHSLLRNSKFNEASLGPGVAGACRAICCTRLDTGVPACFGCNIAFSHKKTGVEGFRV